jgi:hypothetical protein
MNCLSSRINITKERISKLESRSKEINQKSGQKEFTRHAGWSQ